jgi:tetratricopeptide (TPR) repeat protein
MKPAGRPVPAADEGQPSGAAADQGASEPAELDWRELEALLRESAEGAEPEAAQALLFLAARLREDRLGDPVAAFETLEAALGERAVGARALVLRAERALGLQAGTALVAIQALELELGATSSDVRRADLLVEKASLLANALELPEPARGALDAALALVPGYPAALLAERILAERQRDDAFLRAALERALAVAAVPAARAQLLTRLALLAESEAESGAGPEPEPEPASGTTGAIASSDPGGRATGRGVDGAAAAAGASRSLGRALDGFARALDEEPTGTAAAVARAGMCRVAVRLGEDSACLRGLLAEAEAARPGPVRAAWLAAAASVCRHRLGTVERATTTVERALADDPNDVLFLGALAEDHLHAGRWIRAIELLDRQSELVGDTEYLAVLQSHAAHVAEEHLGDDGGAARRLLRVLAARPSDPVALQAMERLASRSGDVALQIELMSGAVGRAEDPQERAALAVRVAELNELGLADLESAAAFARRAIDAIPGYGPAVHTLEGLYARLERWSDVLGVLELGLAQDHARRNPEGGADRRSSPDGATEAPAPPTTVGSAEELAARRLEKLGGIYETGLHDPDKAIEMYRQWVDSGIRKESALAALLRAAEHAGDSLVAAEAALRLGTELQDLTAVQKIAWRYRAANLYEERAASDNDAIAAFESVLELAPRFRPAFAGLARAYRRMGNWAALSDVLSRRAHCEASVTRGALLEVEAARIHAERLRDPTAALAALDRALALEPGNLAALDLRWRFLERLGRFDQAVACLQAICQRLADPVARAAFWRRQAEILEWRLRRPREALVATERALGEGRLPGVVAAEATQERLFDLVGRHGEAAALQLARLGPSSMGQSEAVAVEGGEAGARVTDGGVGRRLDLALRLPDPRAALRLVEQLADARHADAFVLEMAVALANRLGEHERAAAALERLGALVATPSERVAAWRAAIGAQARRGLEPEGWLGVSVASYQRIADADPGSDALFTLERLVARQGDWARVRLVREKLVDEAPEGRARALWLWELGVAHLVLGDRGSALAAFERVRTLAPDLVPVIFLLARLRELTGASRSAADAYVELARASRRVPARAASALRGAARIYADVIRDDAAAVTVLEELLSLDPASGPAAAWAGAGAEAARIETDAEFHALETLLTQRGDLPRLLAVARRWAAGGSSEAHHEAHHDARRDRLIHLAELVRLQRSADAVEPLVAAVALDPRHVPALGALADLFAELGRASEAVATFRRVVGAASDAATVAGAWFKLGKIAATDLGDTHLAVGAFRSSLVAAPGDLTVLSALADALLSSRQYVDAAQVLRQLADLEPDPAARVGHFVRLGEILAGPSRDPEGAADALESALALDPGRGAVVDRLDIVLTDLHAPARLAAALSLHVEAVGEGSARRLRLARLLREPLGQLDRAAHELRGVVRAFPAEIHVRGELGAVLEEAGHLEQSIAEHLGILDLVPLQADSLRALRRLYAQLAATRSAEGALSPPPPPSQPPATASARTEADARARANAVASVLTALGIADAADRRAERDARLHWDDVPRGSISDSDFEAIIRHPIDRHPATGLLAALAEVIPRIHPVNVEEWGVNRADRLPQRADDPARSIVQRLTVLFGIEDHFDVFLVRTGVSQVEVEATFPASLLIPASLITSAPRCELVLQLARALGRLRGGSYLAARLSARELGITLAACMRSRYADYGRGLASEEVLGELAQKVARQLPRRHRRAFDRGVLGVAEAGPLDVNRWRLGMSYTASRASVFGSGDVLGAIENSIRSDRRLASAAAISPSELLDIARGFPEVTELVSFVLGDSYIALRGTLVESRAR